MGNVAGEVVEGWQGEDAFIVVGACAVSSSLVSKEFLGRLDVEVTDRYREEVGSPAPESIDDAQDADGKVTKAMAEPEEGILDTSGPSSCLLGS